jgi:hypothetical protein
MFTLVLFYPDIKAQQGKIPDTVLRRERKPEKVFELEEPRGTNKKKRATRGGVALRRKRTRIVRSLASMEMHYKTYVLFVKRRE